MARYSALGFYKEDGTLDNELVEKTISEPEGQVDVGNPDQPAPSSANVEKPEGGDAEGFEMPTIGSQALDDLKKWNASLTPRDRVSNRLKDYNPEAAPEEEREGVNKAIFEHLCTSPEYLGWGGASANERGVFGLPYGSKTWTQKVQMLKDWACGSGQLMSDDQEEFNALNEEAKRTGDYTKVNELVRSKGEDIWEWVGQGFNIEGLVEKAVTEKLPKDLMDVHAAARAVRNASGMNGIADTAAALAVVQRNYNSIEPERKARYESFISQFKNEANAKLAAERRDAYRAKLDTKNTLQMLELNGETMSDRSRAFVASTAASGVFDGRAFMSLPDAERGHVLACVKIRRGELTKGFGFIPLKDENGKTIDTNRIIYGIGRSITDIPVDTMRTLDDFCSVANAELGTTINPVSIILDPTPWYISLPKEIATKLWNTIGKSSEQIKTERENAYKALELSHQVRNAMTQEIPDASNFWTRSGAGFGDNFGFLLISEVGGFGKLAASRGIKIAENVANGGKVGKVDQFLFSNFVRAGREIGKGRDALKAINLANAPKDVRTAVKIYGEAKRGLPAAKAEYNAALHQFNLAKKTGVNMSESAERLSKASAEYAKMARNANPSVAYEEALSQGQFFRDIVKVNEQIESYMQSVREMGKGIETVGKVAEQAMWYLPFYTRQLDRAAAQGLPMEQAAHRAFVTMITSGWTEKKAITAAAKIGLPAKTLTEQSWKTICTDFIQAFRAKTLGNAMSAAKAGGKALFLREVTNVHHGLDSAVNVTAQSVMDECALLCGEIWDEAKRDWDRGFTVRKDKDGNPVKNFNGDTIVDAFGTKDAFLRFANELVGNGRLVETALNVVKEGAYPAVGFALLSGTNARFGHWRNEIAMRSNLKAGMGERAYSNYALKDGGLAEVYSGMERTQDAVYQFALNDVMKERREEIDNVRAAGDKETADKMEESFKKDAKAIEQEAGGRYSMIMGRVMNSIERANGSTEQVQAICDDFGVDAQTAELLKSMANDYSALRWRDDFNSIWGNFEVGKRITPEGAWSKMRSIFTIRNAEFAFKNFARLAPNVANYTDHGDGTYDVDVDLGNGRSVKVGVSINQQITKALIEESIADGGEVSRLYERMNGTGSWSLLDRAEKKDFAAEYIEGNNRRGGGFYFVGSDGKKYLMPIADVADVITLTDKAQGHVVSHEVSHTIYRAAEEMGFIDLDTKGRLADALAIDRVGDAATRLTDEVSPDGHRKQAWEIEVDEAIARGYADYTNGRSMVAVPAVREGFDKVNRVFDFLRGIFATEALNNETALDDFYEAMMRGDLEALKGIAGDMSHAQSADKRIVRDQALAKVQAARELLARSSEVGKEQARKNLKAAQAELAQANAEWDRVRRDRFERLVGADDGRNSISDDEWERLEENFGVTKNPLETGWITPRGSMLDFSGAHWVDDRKAPNPNHRMVDHADVKEVLSRDFDSNWEYRNEMLDSGAIRTMPEIQALGLARDITAEQEDALYDYIDGIRGDNDITVEFYGDEMRSTDVMTFDGRVSPRAVIRAIHEHFENVAPRGKQKSAEKRYPDASAEIREMGNFSMILGEQGARRLEENGIKVGDLLSAKEALVNHWHRLKKDGFVEFSNKEIWKRLTKDEKTAIKMAFGWEVGADGLWRYETPDLHNAFGTGKNVEEAKARYDASLAESNRLAQECNAFYASHNISGNDVDRLAYNEMVRAYNDAWNEFKKARRDFRKAKFPKKSYKVRDFAKGTEIEKAYPQIMDDPISINVISGKAVGKVSGRDIIVDPDRDVSDVFATITHEIQHKIQVVEGFSRGGNSRYDGIDGYKRLGGEVEARNASRRIGYLPSGGVRELLNDLADKNLKPTDKFLLEGTEDVARESQVILFDFGDSAKEVLAAWSQNGRYSFADEAKALIMKKRSDLLTDKEREEQVKIEVDDGAKEKEVRDRIGQTIEDVVGEINKFTDSKTRKAALNWFIKGKVRLPEDAPKIIQAMGYASRAKGNANTDPFAYESPMAMIDALHKFKPKAKPIDPDTVAELTDKKVLPNGVTTYLVQDDRQGQQKMREIINTHWGEDANPWCLLQGDEEGNLTDDAWHYWNHYNALPKRVAFKDGKLVAFMATDGGRGELMAGDIARGAVPSTYEEWWDRQDSSHEGIPLGNMPVPNDPFGRWTSYEIVDGKIKQIGGFYKTDAEGKIAIQWYANGFKAKEVEPLKRKEYREDGSLYSYYEGYRWGSDGQYEDTLKSYTYGEDGNVIYVRSKGDGGFYLNQEDYSNDEYVQNLVADATRIYNENKQVSKKVTDGKDETGVTRYSLATYEDGGRTVLDTFLRDEVSRGELADADARDIIDATDKIYEIAKRLAKDKRFVNFGNWSQAQVETDEDGHPYFGVIRTNGDYAYNIDFSTVCKKRRPLDYVFGELVRQGVVNESNISKLLSEKNIPKIQDVIKRHGLEVACALCFVDSKRYKIGGDLNKFASIWNNLVDGRENDSAVWRKTISSAMKKEKSGKARNYAERCALTILTSEAARVRVNPTELVNADRFDEWVKANPKVFEMFRSFKGQAKAKDSTGDVPYNNDVIKLFKHRMNENVPAKIKPEDAYAVGGVRLQSFSDFVPKLVFDYVQLWSELAARKLPLHVYTKEPDLVKLFGRTGAKINMSLVPANTGLKADGSYDFADECFPPEEAFRLRDKYGNVGTIMVGINDAHILKCLDDDRIDMVIPYHKSSINPAVAAARGIGKWKDYTSYQHTKGAPKGKDFDFYGSLAKTHDPRRTATEYLKWCKKNGYTPKFKQFSNHPNYYKVLADFRLYDADGKYSPQGAVRQVTPDKAWQKAIVEALKHDQADADRLAYEAQPVIDEIKGEVFGFAEGGRNSLALPPELSGALSTEDLLRMAAAGRLAKNGAGEASVRADMAKRLKELDPNSTDADVDRLIGEAKVEAKAILNGMTNTADAEIMNRLTARQLNKYLSSLRMSGRKGITAGSGSERARQELDKRQAQKIADSIAAQTGISVNELESTLGVDLAETMMILGDIYQEAEKAAMGERPAEAEGGDEVLPMPESAEDTIPLTPEEQERREADIRSLCMDILHKAWEKDAEWQAKKEQRRVDRERQRNTEGEVPAEDDVGGGEELPTTADDLATFIATKQAIDLRNPNQFAQFIAIMCEEKWKADHGLAEDAFVWDDPVALQHLRMTAAGVYDSLARKLMYSNRRETAFNAIAEMENCPTFGSLIGKMEFTGKVIASGMVTEKANELVADIDRLLKQAFGAKGRFSQNKENKDRKVSGETELWARDVRKVLRWGDEKVSSEYNLLMQRLAGVEAAFQLAGRDPQSAKQFAKDMRMIEVLHDFGGLVHKSLGEITDARIKILDRLDSDKVGEEAQAREERTLGIAEMIEKAVETGRTFAYDDKHIGALKKTGRSISKYFQEHLDFKHLLLDLSRYCKDGEAKAKYEDWVNNLQHEIQRRWDKAQTEKRVEALAFKQAVEQIYGGKFDKVMRELMKHDERFDPFGEMIERQMVDAKPDSVIDEMNGGKKKEVERKFKVSMSRAQAMNLYVALQQKGYLDNVVKNNRQGQAAELRKLFTKEDLQVIKWLGDWYDRSRQGISDVSVRIFGLPVEAEESNYFPVTPHRATQGLNEMTSDTWSPFPPALTPRVKHGLDFDVRTDIFSVWMERMQEQAQWKNMAEFGIELRGIFGRQGLQSTIRHCHGEQALSNVKAFINDILRGQVQIKGKNSAVDWMRGWTALSALGGNLGVMLKQTTSIPAFAFEVGFTNLAKYLNPVEMFSAEGRQAMAAIWNSDQRKNRADFANWKAGGSEEVENAFNDANPSRLKKLMQKSMVFNSMGDLVPSLFVGQGIYRSYLAQGVDAEEAMNRTWELINRTQQTGQMDNLTGFQRRSSLGRFATQFQTTVRQYAAYEISAIRNALANPSKKTSIDLIRATACNAVLASLYYWGGAIWQWILGKKPDEETVDGWVKSVLNSCWTSLFFAGAFVQSVSDIIVDGKTRQGATIPSMALTGTVIVDALSAIRSLIDEEKDADDVLKSIDHGLKAFLSPYRDLSKVYHWRIQGEPPDGGAKKSIKKKSLKKKKPLKRR